MGQASSGESAFHPAKVEWGQRTDTNGRTTQNRAAPMSTSDRPLFPPEQAFVVQFMADGDAAGTRCAGRVEHVVSGRSARFDSLEGLFDFIEQVRRGTSKV